MLNFKKVSPIFIAFIVLLLILAIGFFRELTYPRTNNCDFVTPKVYETDTIEDILKEYEFENQDDPWKYISEDGLSMLLELEGFAPEAYWDHKQWSIGYGTKASPEAYMSRIDAIFHLSLQLEEFERVVNENVTVTLSQSQFDALVMLSYNIGPNAFKRSTLLKKINAGVPDADKHFMDWIYAGGQPILVKRRQLERNTYRLGFHDETV